MEERSFALAPVAIPGMVLAVGLLLSYTRRPHDENAEWVPSVKGAGVKSI